MRDEVQDTVDYISITRLHSAYADVVNRRAWAELKDLFLPGAPVRVDMVSKPAIDLVGPTELGRFIGDAIERFSFFEFIVLNARLDLTGADAEAARARMFMCEVRQDRETGEFTRAFGVYHDDYRYERGRWWYARRRYQSLARSGGEVFAFPEEEEW
jgi:hypothetical protein